MHQRLSIYRDQGIRRVVHGDLFLADLRAYREKNLARLGMEGLFPIWHRDTTQLIHDFARLGFRACICCVDQRLPGHFVGRELGPELIAEFPPGIDPCGENGEYHSFVYDGPIFQQPLEIERGQVVVRDGRHYIDLLPRGRPTPAAVAETIPPV
jgi:diphthamide synthase (EF-2-diphthine--ammonia ligase)